VELYEEHYPARRLRLAMLALLRADCHRRPAGLSSSRARSGSVTLSPADATVEALRRLVRRIFRKQRHLDFYAKGSPYGGPSSTICQSRDRRHRGHV